MKLILHTFEQAGILEVFLYGLVINFGIYGCSLGLYSLLGMFSGNRFLGERHPVSRADFHWSIVTVFCNTLVFVVAVYLWKYGFINVAEYTGALKVVVEVLIMTLVMDFLMYVFHRGVHIVRHLNQIHERHHTHESTNLLSLFVLHPVESIGFGCMMLGVLLIVPLSGLSISFYLVLNAIWGTIGHLNHPVLPQSWIRIAQKSFLCTSEFHYLHHRDPGFNFGFYTAIWDVVFKTLHPSSLRTYQPSKNRITNQGNI